MMIRKKLPLVIILISVIPLLLVAVMSGYFIGEASLDIYKSTLSNLSRSVAMQIKDFSDSQTSDVVYLKDIQEYKDLLGTSKDSPDYKSKYASAKELLKADQNTNIYLDLSLLTDTNGTVICSSDGTNEGGDISDLEFFKANDPNAPYTVRIVEKANDGTRISISADIVANGQKLGKIINFVNLEYLNSSIKNYKIGETGYLYVLDNNGEILSHYFKDRIGVIPPSNADTIQLSEVIENVKTNAVTNVTGLITYKYKGTPILASYYILPTQKLIVISAITYEDIYARSRQLSIMIFATALLVIVISLLSGLAVSKKIIVPLKNLQEKIKDIAKGNLSSRLEYTGKDEFLEVCENVNIMADSLQKSTIALIKAASTDILTGISNRKAIYEIMDNILNKSENQAALLMDLNGFKAVNDTLGHDAGDEVLIQFARILANYENEKTFAARLGGDEFFIFLSDFKDKDEVIKLAEKIYDELASVKVIFGKEINISTSIGIGYLTKNDKNKSSLIKKADTSMYECKQTKGKLKYLEYSE